MQRSPDDELTAQWFGLRSLGRGGRTNKERLVRLEAEGRMLPAGRAVVEAAKADGSLTLLDDVEALRRPASTWPAAPDAHPGARAGVDAFPRSVKRLHLVWLVDAKWPAMRAARAEEVAVKAVAGERARA